MKQWLKSEVVRTVQETPLVRRIWLNISEKLEFTPGQFIVCDLPIHEKRTKRWRSYSIANNPNQESTIELCVVHLKGGLGSTFLCQKLKKGDFLTHKRPQGNFVLPENPASKMVFICTGTGVAPFRSMLQSIIQMKNPPRIELIFGTRREQDILYRTEFEQLASENSWFSYHVALSREPNWPNYGYVHHIYERRASEYDNETHFYLCGWPFVVDECFRRLSEHLKIPSNNIKYELYG
jgi:CDP-4-dehydro-6-deoxyglucose reductase